MEKICIVLSKNTVNTVKYYQIYYFELQNSLVLKVLKTVKKKCSVFVMQWPGRLLIEYKLTITCVLIHIVMSCAIHQHVK